MRIGVDLGGTKTEAIALGAGDEVLLCLRRPTPPDYDGTLGTVAGLVREVETGLGRRGTVGVGMPGTISPATGLAKNANSTWLLGRPLKEDLERLLGREVRLANDANCFALSEALDGAAAGASVVFGVIVGTGTGGGIVVDRRLVTGRNAVAGEWGHNPLPWASGAELPGPACWCGKSGCIETFLSGPGLSGDHRAATGEELSAAAIAAAARRGDAAAAASLARHADRMARALASVIDLLDPDAIVLGGGLSNLGHLYAELPLLWSRWVFSDRVDTPLLPPRWGDSSGVRGAARLWSESEAAG